MRKPKTAVRRIAKSLNNKIIELERLAYQPGTFYCPKCQFSLIKQTLSVPRGTIGTTKKDRLDPQLCPNGHGLLEPETYKNICRGQISFIDDVFDFLEISGYVSQFHAYRKAGKPE